MHEIAATENVSVGGVKRLKVSLVVTPGADLADAIRDAAMQAHPQGWDVVFLFVYADRADVGVGVPLARGRWVRKGAKGVTLVPWTGTVDTISKSGWKGTLDIAIERAA